MIDSDGNITPAPNIEPARWIGWRPNEPAPESLAVKQMRIAHGRRITLVLFAALCFLAFPCCWLVFFLLDGPEFQWLFGV